ncbi:hypothetical protein Acr_29g0011360 [Actinidia rufa]|uniref:Protein FAR1-RELATED SEQUENCE n=1 Tax=Actinidia rufa TaxID=165716 RepID=A0A7J0HGH8_9ERIC|nr:hypothetical protein Acr_29g0011360 [Actinidia rufa]
MRYLVGLHEKIVMRFVRMRMEIRQLKIMNKGLKNQKEGMEFDTSDEAYIYYSTYAKEKGFAVSKRNSRKGSDGKLMNVTFQCNRGGKAKVTTINPVKPRPQTKIECPARLNLSICRDGRWRLNKVALEHNHMSWRHNFNVFTTNAKFKEFQKLFVRRLNCEVMSETKVDYVRSKYEVEEDIIFGEFKRKRRVSFIVDFNGETNEANCSCRLFEFKGMVCQHQLAVFHRRRVERLPEKYVLRRWRKDVKRVHTKIRINYDNSSSTIEARRHDNMCNLFNEVADLAEDSEEKYEIVIGRIRELKIELLQSSVICGSNLLSDTPNASASLGDVAIPSKESRNILDPKAVTRKGRPPTTRKQGWTVVCTPACCVQSADGSNAFRHKPFFHPNGHQYGQQMIVGQPGPFFYMPTYPPSQ